MPLKPLQRPMSRTSSGEDEVHSDSEAYEGDEEDVGGEEVDGSNEREPSARVIAGS